jgi:hypothetical protein
MVAYQLDLDHTRVQHWGYVDADRVVTPSSPFNVRSIGVVSVTLSATISGAPADLRILDNQHVMQPGPAHFQPSPSGNSVSYTFTMSGKPKRCGHTIRPQWRSPTGEAVRLLRAQIVITYTLNPAKARMCT